MVFAASEAWLGSFPGAAAGLLVMHGVANPPLSPAMRQEAGRVEAEVRARFGGASPAIDLTETTEVAFAVYAPAAVGGAAVQTHLNDIAANVKLIAPSAVVSAVEVLQAPA